jgi:hypothetical protein
MNQEQTTQESQMSEGRKEIVDEIKRYAAGDAYEKGWDVVIETLSDQQIAILTGKTATFAGAKRVARWVRSEPKSLATLPTNFETLLTTDRRSKP